MALISVKYRIRSPRRSMTRLVSADVQAASCSGPRPPARRRRQRRDLRMVTARRGPVSGCTTRPAAGGVPGGQITDPVRLPRRQRLGRERRREKTNRHSADERPAIQHPRPSFVGRHLRAPFPRMSRITASRFTPSPIAMALNRSASSRSLKQHRHSPTKHAFRIRSSGRRGACQRQANKNNGRMPVRREQDEALGGLSPARPPARMPLEPRSLLALRRRYDTAG
jgi:hypothetical protein